MNEKKWHCLYTKPGREKKVSDHLKKKGITAYYPLTVERIKSIDRRTVSVPLFKSYVFVKISEADKEKVLRTDGVLSFLYWLGSPVQVKDNEINLMRTFISEHTKVHAEKTKVHPTEMVRIVTDNVHEFTSSQTFAFTNPIRIIFPSLGYAIIAETPSSNVSSFISTDKKVNREKYQLATP